MISLLLTLATTFSPKFLVSQSSLADQQHRKARFPLEHIFSTRLCLQSVSSSHHPTGSWTRTNSDCYLSEDLLENRCIRLDMARFLPYQSVPGCSYALLWSSTVAPRIPAVH